eukprot:gb/GECH01001413.1/.p1 GENE.gb/GECH01001413.1/~~gb/GECH01001413.1/.p1  ORF type:complete len:594 (+),score=143.80 gb/GECH01001413.1/:1-1782(+)
MTRFYYNNNFLNLPRLIIVICLVLLYTSFFTFGEQTFSVSRLIQYNQEGSLRGSFQTRLDAPGVAYSHLPQTAPEETTTTIPTKQNGEKTSSFTKFSQGTAIQRQLVVIEAAQMTGSHVFSDLLSRQGVMGVLVILPSPEKSSTSHVKENSGETNTWSHVNQTAFMEAERYLAEHRTDIPVYFAFDSKNMRQVYSSLQKMTSTTQYSFQFVVNARDASLKSKTILQNIEGVLPLSDETNAPKPSIALVAHYDTLGVAPTAVRGIDDNGSGVVAVLELAHMFHKLHETSNGAFASPYHLVFLLTGGGRLNYAGAQHWTRGGSRRSNGGGDDDVSEMSPFEQGLAENVAFALCLEALSGDHLYLHVSQKTKDEDILRLYQQFRSTAEFMNIPFDVKLKKLDISRSEMNWEHEAFLHNGIAAATLSHQSKPWPQLSRSSLIDQKLNLSLVDRNIRFIAESLSNFMFEAKDDRISVFLGNLAPRHEFMAAWFRTLGNVSRAAPYNDELPVSSKTLVSSLSKTLAKYLGESVSISDFEYPNKMKFYGNAEMKMTVFKSRPFSFEILLMIPIAAYLWILYMLFMGSWNLSFLSNKSKEE